MNPPEWDSGPWAMQDYDRPQWAGTEQDMGKYTVNYNDPHYQQDHYRYHQREPQRPTRRMEYGQHSIPSPSPGLSSDNEDNELERKKRKLEEIENRIVRTKAAIALKKVLPYLRKTDELSDNTLEDHKDLEERYLTATKESSLQDRVNCILQLKKSLGLPKVSSELADLTYSGTKGLSILMILCFI